MNRENILLINDARIHVYGVMWHVFSDPASQAQLDLVFNEVTFQALELFENNGNKNYDTSLKTLREQRNNYAKWDISSLVQEYSRLFIGPETVLAPLWESVYVSPKRLLFQASTLEVRAFFSAEGFVFSGYPKEPDDGLAAELDFVRQLALRFTEAFEANDLSESSRLLVVQKEFISQHLLKWIDAFAESVKASATLPYYSALANMLASFLAVDQRALGELEEAFG